MVLRRTRREIRALAKSASEDGAAIRSSSSRTIRAYDAPAVPEWAQMSRACSKWGSASAKTQMTPEQRIF